MKKALIIIALIACLGVGFMGGAITVISLDNNSHRQRMSEFYQSQLWDTEDKELVDWLRFNCDNDDKKKFFDGVWMHKQLMLRQNLGRLLFGAKVYPSYFSLPPAYR